LDGSSRSECAHRQHRRVVLRYHSAMPYSTLWFSMLPLFKNQHLQKLVKKKSSRSVQYFSNYRVLLYSHIHTTYILKYLISNNGCRLHLKYIIELRLYRLNSTLLSITYNIISYHLLFSFTIFFMAKYEFSFISYHNRKREDEPAWK